MDNPNTNPFAIGQRVMQGDNWKGMLSFCLNSGNPQAVAWAKGTEQDLQTAFRGLAESINVLNRANESTKEELAELRAFCRENSKAIKDAVSRIEAELKSEKKKRLRAECINLETTVMVRGVPMHIKASNENRQEVQSETRMMVVQSLTSLGLNPSTAGVKEVVRLRPRQVTLKDGRKVTTDTVKMRFETLANKLDLYKALVSKGKDNPEIKVADAIPFDLIAKKKVLDTLAGDYRTANAGVKTRTVCRFGEMVILIKPANEIKFKKIAVETIRKELGLDMDEDEENSSDNEIDQSPEQKQNGTKGKRRMQPKKKK